MAVTTWGSGAHHSIALAALGLLVATQYPIAATQVSGPQPALAPRPCRVSGVVRGEGMGLPGATVTVLDTEVVRAVTSSDVDGHYAISLAPGGYELRIELAAFVTLGRRITMSPLSCQTAADFDMTLTSRSPGGSLPPVPALPADGARGGVGGGRGGFGPGGRGRQGGAARFQTLAVEQSSAAPTEEAVLTATVGPEDDPAARLLPPGFASGIAEDSIAVSGTVVQVDRVSIGDRAAAIARGELTPGDGPLGLPAAAALGQVGGDGGGGGRGGFGGLGGRGAASRPQINVTYGLGGSMFDSAPYALRDQPVTTRDYLQQNFSSTLGGALRIPRIYDGTNRTTYNFSFTAGHSENLFDQYATVPSDAYRRGDFSASPAAILDPLTGQPFPGNQIPAERMSAAARALLPFMPNANLSGDTRNFHITDTTRSNTDSFSLRISHTLTQPQAGRGGRGAGGRGGGGRGAAASPTAATPTGAGAAATPPGTSASGAAGGAPSAPTGQSSPPAGATAPPPGQGRGAAGAAGLGGQGRGGRGAAAPLNASIAATVNYRRNNGDRSNVYPLLAGTTTGSTFTVPVNLNIRAGRSMHTISASLSRTSSSTLNDFAFARDVVGEAGIAGVATDPFDWGVPSLTFGTFTPLRDVAPSRRLDRSWQVTYGLTRPAGNHNWRVGGTYQTSLNETQSDSNARGTFTFTGLYTAGGLSTVRGSGQDFADFLLGLPQQAPASTVSPPTTSARL